MSSFLYLFSKFSKEALILEAFIIAFLFMVLFGYYLFKRRRYGIAKSNIPDQVVRAYLAEVLSLSESFRIQLFGDTLQTASKTFSPSAAVATGGGSAEAALLQGQLAVALKKSEEQNQIIKNLQAEKAALEERAKKAEAAAVGGAPAVSAPAANAGDDGKLKQELDAAKAKIKELEARLAEYEIIEDDLANLKRLQQENKRLKAEVDQLNMALGGDDKPAMPAPTPVAAPAPTPVAAAPVAAAPVPEPVAAAPVPEPAAAAPAPEPVPEPVAAAPAPEPAAGAQVADPAAAAATQAIESAKAEPPADAPAEAASSKSDADLLSEFEKMLSN